MAINELDRAPATGPLFRRAAMDVLPLVGRRRRGRWGGAKATPGADHSDVLPDTTLVLRGVRVDRTGLARYDRVCGFPLADTLPPTYPHVLAFPLAMALMSGPEFPLPMVGLVHVANRIEVLRPVNADEPLDLAVHATDLRPHDRGRQFDVVATASVGDEQVWRGVSTYLHRQGEAGTGQRQAPVADAVPAPVAVWRVAARVGTDYAAVSGDHNPIHTSRLGARAFGFPRRIAHGMWSKARCLAALGPRLPDAYTVEVRFKRPILLPATVAFSANPPQSFALHDTKTPRPHLSGTVTPAS